mgnify:CR=1 FL=1
MKSIQPQATKDGGLSAKTDYVAGRMMKTSFEVSAAGVLTIHPPIPRLDYQSWGARYRTAKELIEAVEKTLSE